MEKGDNYVTEHGYIALTGVNNLISFEMSSFLERLANSALRRVIKEGLDKIFDRKGGKEKIPAPTTPSEPEVSKTHPWRLCPKVMSGFFVRLQAGDKCRAYFSDDCDLPKNYWAGVKPAEPQSKVGSTK